MGLINSIVIVMKSSTEKWIRMQESQCNNICNILMVRHKHKGQLEGGGSMATAPRKPQLSRIQHNLIGSGTTMSVHNCFTPRSLSVGRGLEVPGGWVRGYERFFPCVRLRGLPFSVADEDIHLFLVGTQIASGYALVFGSSSGGASGARAH